MSVKLSYCGELVKRVDEDRFLLSLFALPEKREAIWALFAFNYEIARLREEITEPMMGKIRLQWWRDTLDKIEKSQAVEGDIAKALSEAVREYSLPLDELHLLINARERDFDETPLVMPELESYADQSSTPLFLCTAKILGCDPVCPSAGIAYALTGLSRVGRVKDCSELIEIHLDMARQCGCPHKFFKAAIKLVELYRRYPIGQPIPFKGIRVWLRCLV